MRLPNQRVRLNYLSSGKQYPYAMLPQQSVDIISLRSLVFLFLTKNWIPSLIFFSKGSQTINPLKDLPKESFFVNEMALHWRTFQNKVFWLMKWHFSSCCQHHCMNNPLCWNFILRIETRTVNNVTVKFNI